VFARFEPGVVGAEEEHVCRTGSGRITCIPPAGCWDALTKVYPYCLVHWLGTR
jgi:hypothetical protein